MNLLKLSLASLSLLTLFSCSKNETTPQTKPNKIELGPTKGITLIPLLWASNTTSAPGSATPGQPASDIRPMSAPCNTALKTRL